MSLYTQIQKYRDTYQSLPKLSNLKMLWRHGYWDGPQSGVCEVDGAKCWFEMIEQWEPEDDDESEDILNAPWYRRYLIWKLTPEQFSVIERDHAKFRHMVGAHTDYDDNGAPLDRFIDGTVTQDSVDQYFAEKEMNGFSELNYLPDADHQIIGWYES